MNNNHTLCKTPTGIPGLDDVLRGGLPRERTTLVVGPPGSGKTVMALQTLVNGAVHHNEPGVLVALEESAAQIIANAADFGWELERLLDEGRLLFVDAHVSPDTVNTGGFDLTALLAGVQTQVEAMGARRIVFDSLDVLLAMLDDPVAERQELYRIKRWLANDRPGSSRGLTGIITSRRGRETWPGLPLPFMEFVADCVISLEQHFQNQVSLRSLRVVKYRGL